jgi:glycosyltransferase involved in cell wall biosynthesis
MKIAIVTDWFAENMGYAENFLPKALASLGAEVHVITSNVQPYFNSPFYAETYEPYIGPGIVDCGVKELDGYTLHRLPHGRWRGGVRINGLVQYVWKIKPRIVQTFSIFCRSTYELALAKPILAYKLFHEQHVHASVFPPATQWIGIRKRFVWLAYAATVGRFVSLMSEKCYPISVDASDIAIQFWGYQANKVSICSLGVDTDLFVPAATAPLQEQRQRLRRELGFAPSDIVCVYAGRLTNDKGPLLLAQAIALLVQEGRPFRGLFVGNGQRTDVEAIQACPGSVVHPFVPVRELPTLYRAGDIGVWPKQESTSQLDASACGLPLVLSDQIQVRERVEGNGLIYKEGDAAHLAQQLCKLSDPETRQVMGKRGIKKILENFSWNRIAMERLHHYERALQT